MSKRIAYGGIFSALSILLLYFTAVVPSGRLGAYALCSIPIALTIIELGVSTGLLVYISVSILSFLLIGNIGDIIPYILFFGHYAIFKYYIEKGKNIAVELLLKFLVFNGSLALTFLIFTKLFSIVPIGLVTSTPLMTLLILAAAQIVFFIYDYIFSRILAFYLEKRNNYLKRDN